MAPRGKAGRWEVGLNIASVRYMEPAKAVRKVDFRLSEFGLLRDPDDLAA